MCTYLIRLTPHDKFFFGTGKEFGPNNQHYFIKSGYFPQQTTLLGMLRYQLLCQAGKNIFNKNKIQDKKEAATLIGLKSFIQGEYNTFGAIQSLSPLFLMQNKTRLFPLSKEYQRDKENYKMCEISKDFNLLKDYEAKKGLPELWTDEQGKKYLLEDLFTEVEQVGIRKNYDGKTDDKAFYMQTYRRFKTADTAFAFYVRSTKEIRPSNLVFMGRERQSFTMEVEKVDHSFQVNKKLYQASKNAHKVILLSDAYFNEISDYNQPESAECNDFFIAQHFYKFAITETIKFRCLQANLCTKTYYNIRKKEDDEKKYNETNRHKSKQIELYKRGSIFYFSNEEDMRSFTEKLENSEFHTIGYNHFITIKKS